MEALRNALQGIMLEQTPVTMDGKKVKALHLNFYSLLGALCPARHHAGADAHRRGGPQGMIGFPGLYTAHNSQMCVQQLAMRDLVHQAQHEKGLYVGRLHTSIVVVERSVFLHASQTNMLQPAKEWQRKLLVDGAGSEE